jgi:hypothetical protein
MVVDQAFEGGAWLGDKKSQTWEAFNLYKKFRHQDHAKMNARILGHAMVGQRQNDQKVASRTHAKTQRE